MRARPSSALLAAGALATLAPMAQAGPVVVARTGITGFNLPDFSSINSSTVVINDASQVAVKVGVVGGTGGAAGLFYGSYLGGTGTGGIVHTSAAGEVISDPDLNDLGAAAYMNLDTDDLWSYDTTNGAQQLNLPLGADGVGGLGVTNGGLIGGRISFGFTGDVWGAFDRQSSGSPSLTTYAADDGIDASSPYSFLFTPDMAQDSGHIGGKVLRNSGAGGGNQVRRFSADGSSVLVASDTAADATSPYSSISNSMSISDDGTKIAFTARLASGGADTVLLWDAGTGSITPVAVEGSGDVDIIDFFAPDVNDAGHVVFRANDGEDIFLFDGAGLSRVAGVGDLVMTDIGEVELGRRDGDFSLSGGPRINNLGDVAYLYQYFDPNDPNSVADGTLLLVSPIPEPAAGALLAGLGALALRRRRR